ncbi:hypothetical protein JR316_0006049 [Psilocybe cubensis]|uniref:Uncharacterized protein n=2 Tax=Psilocybe cubensis TaxID=181762 RepID=A0ACB8H1F9_PSICU|nr:hypothetical protein JR316_0006049 [Psilocybe cubensis]KAH9481522.1 hypothetical protein JR316_0006049 [Psilocybe cubensis]
MPRRSQTRASNLHTAITTSSPPPLHDSISENLTLLRKQWRWAAFSQFYYTFAQLFNTNDVTISDIERDLVHQSNTVISRIMQKLLYALSYDRKVTTENWQTALRKQYNKRDPASNPLGPEPKGEDKGTKEEEKELALQELAPAERLGQDINGKELVDGESSTPKAESVSLEHTNPDTPLPETAQGSRQSSVLNNTKSASVSAKGLQNEEEEQKPSVNWFDLPVLTKLESLHTLVEWQFQNPIRLRTIMKSDDELASWRVEPIGYDSKHNAYWFIGGERLWIQRVPPKPPKTQASKRKRPTGKVADNKASSKAAKTSSKSNPPPKKRPRMEEANTSSNVPSSSGRHSRAAKDQAKIRLDLQAKELAKLSREVTKPNKSPAKQPSRMATRVVGTRTSARLRGQEDEWQPIPNEWLNSPVKPKTRTSAAKVLKTGLESDEESDLTELSEDDADEDHGEDQVEEVEQPAEPASINIEATSAVSQAADEMNEKEKVNVEDTFSDFTEWETLCVTLFEWEHIAERFANATYYAEKALYKLLVNDIVPAITHELREIEKKRELEEALSHRKRSSRLAIRESEREEARLAAKRKQEEEEKFSRTRRLEARQQKEEEERIKRENAREQRRKEREAREESRKALTAQENLAAEQAAAKAKSAQEAKAKAKANQANRQNIANGKNGNHSGSGSRTPAGEDWELSCEICHRQGINLDDGTPMMSCGRCSKWQHIRCHDRADQAAGRPRRNWDAVDFICKNCRAVQQNSYHRDSMQMYNNAHHHQMAAPSQTHPYRPYPQQQHMNSQSDRHVPYPDYRGGVTPQQQSFYVRPSYAQHQQKLPTQYRNAPPPSANIGRPTISFSHYQPSEHGFSPGPQPTYADQQHPYYGVPNPQYRAPPSTSSPYKPQATWNITTPAHAPGYALPHNGAAASSNPTQYRNSAHEHRPDIIPTNEPPPQLYPRYPEQHYQYPQSNSKHLPTSYQPPLGR